MLKALWAGMLVFIPFGFFVLITSFILKIPSIYRYLHAKSYVTFLILSLASIALTCLYFYTLNRALVQKVEVMAQWQFLVRWLAVIVVGVGAAVIVSVVFSAVVLLIGYVAIYGKRLS
jgi:hypothetical protein